MKKITLLTLLTLSSVACTEASNASTAYDIVPGKITQAANIASPIASTYDSTTQAYGRPYIPVANNSTAVPQMKGTFACSFIPDKGTYNPTNVSEFIVMPNEKQTPVQNIAQEETTAKTPTTEVAKKSKPSPVSSTTKIAKKNR